MFFKRFTLELTVFVCGALVMIYEIIGSRLLSPYLGASTYVWTSLIGVILAALSLGYYLGGKWADRRPDLKNLALVIFLAGGAVSATILLKDLILSFVAESSLILEMKTLLAALLLFAPAAVLLGVVTPYAVKLKITSLAESGETVGRLYAFSTVGSILGTFLAGFVFIPFVGSERSLYLVGATLIALSILLAGFHISRLNVAILIAFVLGVSAGELKNFYLKRTLDLHDVDTEYSRVQIFKTVEPKTGKPIRALASDPFFIQSAMFLDGSNESVFPYSRYYHLINHFKPDFRRSLLVGGAGCSFPKEYLERYKKAEIDVVEIDPRMTEIAREFFNLRDDARLKFVHQDGRVFLNRVETGKYDAVFMDAFGSLLSVPFQLTTVEAVRQIERALTDDGVVIFNLGGAIRGEASGFLQAELKTYRQIFPRVYLFKVNADYTDEQLQNLIIVAVKEKNASLLVSDEAETTELLEHLYAKDLPLDREILTDDLAPVEYYNSFAQSVYKPRKIER